MFWNRLSIGKKLFVTIMVTVTVTLSFLTASVLWNTRNGIYEYILSADIARLSSVASALSEVYDPSTQGWPEFENNRFAFNDFVRHNIVKPRDRPPGGEQELARRNRTRQAMTGRLSLLDKNKAKIIGPFEQFETMGYHPIVVADDGQGEAIVGYLGLGMPNLDRRTADLMYERDQMLSLLLTAILAITLSIISAIMLSRLFVHPISQLLSGAKKLSDGSLDTRLEITRFDEMGELQTQFNKLATALEANERSERQWISDTSHELQTPLAILRAEIEALQDGVREADPKTLETLHDSIIRLSSLVKDISLLSQAREGAFGENMHDEDLSEIVQTAAEHAASLLTEAELEMELEIEPELIVKCNKTRIRQLIDNLISNSIRYTNLGGKVRLKVFRERKRVFIHCEDSAPSPSKDSIPKLFDRFFRDDRSRSRRSGGSGLGLPICWAIVTAHRGQIQAEKSELGGLKVTVALPIHNYAREDT